MHSTEIQEDRDVRPDTAAATQMRTRWWICLMLFIATSINYMDRQVIALLKPTLQHAIGMSEISYGYIVDAFQIAYAVGVLAAGWFVDRFGTRIGYLVVMTVWSLSAMGHALANSVLEFGIARFFLGLGESGNFPAAIKTVGEWFPQRERSLATGLFNSGATVGAVLAPLTVPWVALHFGWHATFLITGSFSAVWIIWWFLTYEPPAKHKKLRPAELSYINQDIENPNGTTKPWLELLKYRQTWAFSLGKFLTDPIWWFYLFWLPSYLSSRFNLDLSHIGLPLVLIYAASAVGSIGGGWLPALFLKFKFKPATARLAAMLSCAVLVVPILVVTRVRSEPAAIALIGLAAAAHCGWAANLFTTVSDMFPRTAVGSVIGIGTMAGSIGGALLATSAGYILQWTHSYTSLFSIAASAYLVAFVLIVSLAPGLARAPDFEPAEQQ